MIIIFVGEETKKATKMPKITVSSLDKVGKSVLDIPIKPLIGNTVKPLRDYVNVKNPKAYLFVNVASR